MHDYKLITKCNFIFVTFWLRVEKVDATLMETAALQLYITNITLTMPQLPTVNIQ